MIERVVVSTVVIFDHLLSIIVSKSMGWHLHHLVWILVNVGMMFLIFLGVLFVGI